MRGAALALTLAMVVSAAPAFAQPQEGLVNGLPCSDLCRAWLGLDRPGSPEAAASEPRRDGPLRRAGRDHRQARRHPLAGQADQTSGPGARVRRRHDAPSIAHLVPTAAPVAAAAATPTLLPVPVEGPARPAPVTAPGGRSAIVPAAPLD